MTRDNATAYRIREGLLENALDLVPTPLVLVEPGTARVTFANKAADKLAGGTFPKGESSEEYDTVYRCYYTDGKRIPTEEMPGVRAARGEVINNFQMDWDAPCGRRSLIVNSDSVKVEGSDSKLYIITFQDITELKQAQSARQKIMEENKVSERRHSVMIEQSPVGIQIFAADGSLIKVNKAWEKLWNMSAKQVEGYNVLNDKQLMNKGIMRYIKKGFDGQPTPLPTLRYEVKQQHGSGFSYRWVRGFVYPVKDERDVVQEVVIVHEDVTRQRKALETIKQSEEYFRTMADSAPVMIWISGIDKLCTYFNKPWLDFTGRTMEQERGTGWSEGVHPNDFDRCLRIYTSSFDARTPFNMEYRLRRHDGSFRWILDSGAPRFSPSGEFLGYVGSCIDIHDFKQALRQEHELRMQRSYLVQINKAKDEFISVASHQLRTPASGVKQYLGMVLQDGFTESKLSDEHRALLQIAYESNQRQIQIIEDLLRVAGVDAGKIKLKLETLDLVPLIEDVLSEQAGKFARRKQKANFLHPDKKQVVKADKARLRMVLENIIDNSSKYSFPGKPIQIKLKRHNGFVSIVIADKGVGISKKDLDKLFQKFSRLNNPLSNEVDGTGLGLYWAKKIIDLHRGDIQVDSKLGQGSKFTISLPASIKEDSK